jgi:hypothetical protein
MSRTHQRAAEVLREYAALIEQSLVNRSGPLKGRCDPEIEAEIVEYRALAAALEAAWVVLLRVTPTSRWCAYGPATHRKAIEFRQKSVGAGMVREIAQLIPLPRAGAKPGDESKK